MNFGTTLALGAVAGGTIVLGLPIGRLQLPRRGRSGPALRRRGGGAALPRLGRPLRRVGAHRRRSDRRHPRRGALPGLSALFVLGISAGLLSVVAYERFLAAVARPRPTASPRAASLALLVAIGIGVHNLAEGLAIGQSAASGAIGLAAVLVVGFALHNATEGFGIVAPLAGRRCTARPGASCCCSARSAVCRPSSAPRSASPTPARCSACCSCRSPPARSST